MKRYAHVKFTIRGEERAHQQQELMRDMARIGVITITEERLKEFFEADRKDTDGVDIHNYVLHGWREWRAFRKLMKNPKYEFGMNGISWWITCTPQNDSFRKWLIRNRKGEKACGEC